MSLYNSATFGTHIRQQLIGRHAAQYEQAAQDDLQVVWPAGAERRPQLLQLLGVVVADLPSGPGSVRSGRADEVGVESSQVGPSQVRARRTQAPERKLLITRCN